MKDCRGREIHIGSVIVYPGRASSSLWLNVGKVVGIDDARRGYRQELVPILRVRRSKDDKLVTLSELYRVAVVEAA